MTSDETMLALSAIAGGPVELIHTAGQLDIAAGHRVTGVRRKSYRDPIIDIGPLGMMIGTIRYPGHGRHEGKGVGKVRKYEFTRYGVAITQPAGRRLDDVIVA